MESFYQFLANLNKKYLLEQSISYSSTDIKFSFSFKAMECYDLLAFFEESLFSLPNVDFSINSAKKRSYQEFFEKIIEDPDDELIFLITYKQILNDNLTSVTLLNEISLNKWLKEVFIQPLSYLGKLNNKVNLNVFDITAPEGFYSTIFTINSNNTVELDEFTFSYISNLYNKYIIVAAIPGVINEDFNTITPVLPYKDAIVSQLKQLSNSHILESFHFIGKKNIDLSIDTNISTELMKSVYKDLTDTIIYIFNDARSSDQKLTFYRKIFIESNKSITKIIIDNKLDPIFFENILFETQLVFDSFEDGEISTFMKEKKEIIKEYLSISKEIIQSTNNQKDHLLRNLITIAVLLLTNFFVKAYNQLINDSALYAISILLIILLILTAFNDAKNIFHFNKRIDIIDKHFKFLSTESKELNTSMNTLSKQEMKSLSFLIYFSFFIYSVISIVIIIFLLYKYFVQ